MKRWKLVPWWNDECSAVIKTHIKAFNILKNTYNLQNFIEYKRIQAVVQETIKETRIFYWRMFCDSIGRSTPINQV